MKLKRPSLTVQIIIALILGVFLGLYLGPSAKSLAEIGKLIIQLIKVAAIPLLFLTILNAILTTEVSLKDGVRMIGFSFLNASFALTIGLTLTNWIRPGEHLNKALTELPASNGVQSMKLDLISTLRSYLPGSLAGPFVENAIIPIVIMTLFFGLAVRSLRDDQDVKPHIAAFLALIQVTLKATEKVLSWIIQLVPVAVLSTVAYAVGEQGFAPLKGLAYYVGVGLLGLFCHILIVYQAWLYFYIRWPLKRFWSAAREPIAYAVGANSSLATLPMTLKALKKLGVSDRSASLGACVGTNLNNDGIILYEVMAVMFVAQAMGIDLSLSQQIMAALLCLVAAAGVAGVPEAGFISLSIVLTTLQLPLELLPLLLSVDWVIARARSLTNVTSDMMISILIDKASDTAPQTQSVSCG